MGNIVKALNAYNTFIIELGKEDEDDDWYFAPRLEMKPTQNTGWERLTPLFHFDIPPPLLDYYKNYGGLGPIEEDRMFETNTFRIFTPSYLLVHAQSKDNYNRIGRLGLIEMINYSWGNSRGELHSLQTEAFRQRINENYQCIGWYRLSWGLEEAYYVYFDRQGCFGTVRYHQDEFDALEQQLNVMAKESPARFSFEGLMQDILVQLRASVQQKVEEERNG